MNIEKQWAIISYTLIAVLSGLYVALIIGASAFGPLLAAASLGLYHVLAKSVSPILLQLAVIFNVLGAAIFTTMLLVQLAIRHQLQSTEQETIDLPALRTALIGVQPGMDVAWDILYP